MDIQSEQRRRALIISLAGSLDALTAGDAQAFVGRRLAEGQERVVLDLSQCGFMSSSGIRVLLDMLKKSRETKCDFRLAAAQPGVQRTLEIAGLVPILKAYRSVEDAERSFGSHQP